MDKQTIEFKVKKKFIQLLTDMNVSTYIKTDLEAESIEIEGKFTFAEINKIVQAFGKACYEYRKKVDSE